MNNNTEKFPCFVVKAKGDEDALHISQIYDENRRALHGEPVSRDEWREYMSENDADEANFLIMRENRPVGWLKLNGLDEGNTGWISMLAVESKTRRRGVGRFAVKFAEDFFRRSGKRVIAIHTTEDNIAAIALYKSCGFCVSDRRIDVYGDGATLPTLKFEKRIE